jgi:hypothetical protein
MSQQTEKITHILLNDTNYLSWVHTITGELEYVTIGKYVTIGRSKLEYVTGELPKPEPVNPNFPTAQEKKH